MTRISAIGLGIGEGVGYAVAIDLRLFETITLVETLGLGSCSGDAAASHIRAQGIQDLLVEEPEAGSTGAGGVGAAPWNRLTYHSKKLATAGI